MPQQDPPRTSSMTGHRLLRTLDTTVQRLGESNQITRHLDIQEVLRLADMLRRDEDGLAGLAERMPHLEESGFFQNTPWEHLDRLVPSLVAGGFAAGGHHAVMETLNALRVFQIAEGRIAPAPLDEENRTQAFGKPEATEFLEEIVALNAWALFPGESEATRHMDRVQLEATHLLFQFLIERLPDTELLAIILDEIELVSAQQPLLVDTLFDRIHLAERVAKKQKEKDPRLAKYLKAIRGPGPLSGKSDDENEYLRLLEKTNEKERRNEAKACATSMLETGLVCRMHGALVRWAATHDPDLLDLALGLDERGRLERRLNETLVKELIDTAVTPQNAQAVHGLGRTLERGLLSRHEVAGGFRRLLDLKIHPEVRRLLDSTTSEEIDAKTRLVGGALRVLGHPLGIGQGRNPTCQSARGISIWSLNRPGYLLELIATAARDAHVTMWFLGDLLDSRDLIGGLMDDMHPELDPVSLVLVPHLDRIYNEMMRRVAGRGEDGHKWVNPAMYGRLVPGALASAFNPLSGHPEDVRGFVTRFYRTHHPDHCAEHGMVYPNPVGLVITSAHGTFIGFHAVTIQRIARDDDGRLRVYFYNPNNESRQDWGQDIIPSVMGHGENHGEASLPFHQFTSRLYAFHYDPFWIGEGSDLEDKEIDQVMDLIDDSWLKTGPWAAQTIPGAVPPEQL
jgi:hypothetical protein